MNVTGESRFALTGRRSLAEQVVERIRAMIISGDLVPGDRLPPATELSEQMGVSRTALREGIKTLEAQGLLETRAGVGTVVKAVGTEQLVQPMSLYVATSELPISFEEFHAVRTILETEIAAFAAANAVPNDIETLRSTMEDMKATIGDGEAFASSDARFHESLAIMTGNPLLQLLISAIRVLLEEHIRQVVAHIDPIEDVLPYHEAIIEAVARGDVEASRQAMRDHLLQVRTNYEQASRVSEV